MKQVSYLNPFGRFCCTIGNLPSSYMESLTYEQQLLWFLKFLDEKVIPAVNTNADAIVELQNYLKNLDLQDEVNNKLDEMAESGELTEIIAQYLQLAGLLCYSTKADLKGAENLVDGSFAKTFGTSLYNDGYGHDYKIRTLLNTDVIDDDNLIALTNYPTLVAEKIPNNNFNSTFTNLQNQITAIDNNVLTEMVVIGDSYTAYNDSTWAENLASQLHLTLHKYANGGTGYLTKNDADDKTFLEWLDYLTNSSFKNKVKYVICYGGVNDSAQNMSDLSTAVSTFCENAKTIFTNARIMIVGPQKFLTTESSSIYKRLSETISKSAYNSGVSYTNPMNWLTEQNQNPNELYANDKIHPNSAGYKYITSKMLGLINGNNESTYNPMVSFDTTNVTGGTIRTSKNIDGIDFDVSFATSVPANDQRTILNVEGFQQSSFSFQCFPVFEFNTQYSVPTNIVGIMFTQNNNGNLRLRFSNTTGSNLENKSFLCSGRIKNNFTIDQRF